MQRYAYEWLLLPLSKHNLIILCKIRFESFKVFVLDSRTLKVKYYMDVYNRQERETALNVCRWHSKKV
jgi:hypothetical protein